MKTHSSDNQNDRRVDVPLALRVYQTILENGIRDDGGMLYLGLRAITDFDGYTVQVSDGTVTLRIFFHNRFTISPANNRRAIEQFLRRLGRIATKHNLL